MLATGLWWAYGGRTRFGWLALVCASGVAFHLVYDVVTSWGTMLLYPFSSTRYALDWLFIVDFVTWALPIAVLIASRRRPELARMAVVAWMLALLFYGTSAALVHRSAIAEVVSAEQAAGRATAEAFAFPRFGAPWRWAGVAVAPRQATDPRIAMYTVRGLPPEAGLTGRIDRSFDDPWVRAALATRSGQSYLWWARVPVAAVVRAEGEVTVTLNDLRYTRTILPAAETSTPFAIRFRFDERTGRLIDASW